MYTIDWYIKNRVVLVTLSEIVSVNELIELNQRLVSDYLDHALDKVHLIVDGSDVTKLPNDLYGITKASKPLTSHPNMGSSIYVQFLNSILGFLANVATQIVGQPYKMVNSLEEADKVLDNLGIVVNSSPEA